MSDLKHPCPLKVSPELLDRIDRELGFWRDLYELEHLDPQLTEELRNYVRAIEQLRWVFWERRKAADLELLHKWRSINEEL